MKNHISLCNVGRAAKASYRYGDFNKPYCFSEMPFLIGDYLRKLYEKEYKNEKENTS